jgi:hypothetical protein
MMTIFNVQLFGSDADWFCSLTASEQVSWIRSNTNQMNDDLINEFLSNSLHNRHDYCFTCRDNKKNISIAKIVENGNISEGNEQEVATVVEPTISKKPRKHRNNK